MHNAILFLILLSAHLTGDYYLQSQRLAKEKENQYPMLLKHALIYTACVLFTVLIIESPWWLLLALVLSHCLIDSLKFWLSRTKLPKPLLYAADQTLHLIALWLAAVFSPELAVRSWIGIIPLWVWAWLALFLLILKPVNISIDILFERYATASKNEQARQENAARALLSDPAKAPKPEPQLEDAEGAGAWVGSLERLITVLFAFLGQYSAMGLLMAAKSMARFDRISKNPAFAEYYLIGTLFSILFAIAAYLFIFKLVFPIPLDPTPSQIILITPTPQP